MSKRMLVNTSDPDECRVAVVAEGELEELFIEHASSEHYVGNIYKGRVENVEPSIQAAFIDLGLERNGFLHVSDVNPDYLKGTHQKKGHGHEFPRLQNVLRRGQEVVVQVTKSGIGTKGPALTTYLSLAGRFLVLMPNIKRHGVSRKIEDDAQRLRLKEALAQMNAPTDMGVIVRTAGDGRTKRELQRDLNYLQRLYEAIDKRTKQSKAPSLIYQESDLVTRVIRDFFTPETEEVVIDSEPMRKKAMDFLQGVMPRYTNRVKLYEGEAPIFHAYSIEKQIESIYQRRVELPGGGYIIIDQTEALVAIDINSGSFRENRDPEENAYKLDMLAAKEVARQLRLRDLGGVIVIDFIDMMDAKHRRDVEKALGDALKLDKARYKVLRMSDFGIVEMTRQRMRPSVRRSMFQECPHCQGTGQMRTAESMAIAVLRLLPLVMGREDAVRVEVTVSREVAHHLSNIKRRDIAAIEDKYKRTIVIRGNEDATVETVRFVCYDRFGTSTEVSPACEVPAAKQPAQPQRRERRERREPRQPREPREAREAQPQQAEQPEQAEQPQQTEPPQQGEQPQQPQQQGQQPRQGQRPQQGQPGQPGEQPRRGRRRRGRRHGGQRGQQQGQQGQQQAAQQPPQPVEVEHREIDEAYEESAREEVPSRFEHFDDEGPSERGGRPERSSERESAPRTEPRVEREAPRSPEPPEKPEPREASDSGC